MTSSKRTNTPLPFRMTERDYRILHDIALCGGLTAQQIGRSHGFGDVVIRERQKGNPEGAMHPKLAIHSNCQRRMKLLKAAGFVQRIERYQLLSEGKKPYLYSLTRSGAQSLAGFLGCSIEDTGWRERETRLRPNYIEHLVLTNDIRLAVMRAVRESGDIELVTWHDELTLAKTHSQDKIPLDLSGGVVQHVTLVPDAYFVLRFSDGQERHHFLEIDRGTETAASADPSYRTVERKVRTYLRYFYKAKNAPAEEKSLFEQRYGATGGRILIVTTSPQRMVRLMEVSEAVGAQQRFWFTTFATATQPVMYRLSSQDSKGEMEVLTSSDVVGEGDKLIVAVPNILDDGIWTMARHTEGGLHSLTETFRQARR